MRYLATSLSRGRFQAAVLTLPSDRDDRARLLETFAAAELQHGHHLAAERLSRDAEALRLAKLAR